MLFQHLFVLQHHHIWLDSPILSKNMLPLVRKKIALQTTKVNSKQVNYIV